MARSNIFWTVFDALNYWVLTLEVFRSDSKETAHRKALDELEKNHVSMERLSEFVFAPMPLQKNFQGLEFTRRHNMYDLRADVQDYFAYTNAEQRLRALTSLYRSNAFRAAGEKVYVEQRGSSQRRSTIDIRGSSSKTVPPTSVEDQVRSITRGVQDSHQIEQTSSALENRTSSQPVGAHIRFAERLSSAGSTTSTTSISSMCSEDYATSVLTDDSGARIAVEGTKNPQAEASGQKLGLSARLGPPVAESNQVQTGHNIPEASRNSRSKTMEEDSAGSKSPRASDNKRKANPQDTQQMRKKVKESIIAPASASPSTTPAQSLTKGDVQQLLDSPFVVRAAAVKASENIRHSYNAMEELRRNETDANSNDGADDTDSISSDPPMKHQWTEENAKILDLGECQFCHGFYSRIQGGGLCKHETYWCVLNPNRRDRIRSEKYLAKVRARDEDSQTRSARETPDAGPAGIPTTGKRPDVPQTSPRTENSKPVQKPRQASRSNASRSSLPSSALKPNTTPSSTASSSTSAELQDDSSDSDDHNQVPLPVVHFARDSIAAETQAGGLQNLPKCQNSEPKTQAPKKMDPLSKTTQEDWEMVEMYITSGSPANEVIDLINETFQQIHSTEFEPRHAKLFLRKIVASSGDDELSRWTGTTFKYLSTCSETQSELKVDSVVVKAMLTVCERRKVPCMIELLQVYLGMFGPSGRLRMWQYLSRMTGGIELVKRYRALTD